MPGTSGWIMASLSVSLALGPALQPSSADSMEAPNRAAEPLPFVSHISHALVGGLAAHNGGEQGGDEWRPSVLRVADAGAAGSSSRASQLQNAVTSATEMVKDGQTESAKLLMADLVSQGPIRRKIEDFLSRAVGIDAPPGSKELAKRLESADVPELTEEEALAIHLLAATSSRDGTETRCGDHGTDALLQFAALSGHAPSQFRMGVLLAGGTACGWQKDPEAAAYWYSKAAEQGHEDAEVNYAITLLLGAGVPKDVSTATKMLVRSANERGNARAQYLLGMLHVGGHGVRKSQRTAIKLFRASAEQGFFPAQTSLGKILWERAVVEKEWDEAREWLLKGAEQGDPQAQYALGKAYISGVDGEFWRFDKAIKWFTKAAERGHPEAQTALGLQYWNGDIRTNSMAPRHEDAVRWFRPAADQGQPMAQAHLGYAYAGGKAVAQDYATAISWWRKAAEQNNSWAEEALGDAYSRGLGVPRDEAKAREWHGRAAEHGSMGAKDKLAKGTEVTGSEMLRLALMESVIEASVVLIGVTVLFGGGGGGGGSTYCPPGGAGCDPVGELMMHKAVGLW